MEARRGCVQEKTAGGVWGAQKEARTPAFICKRMAEPVSASVPFVANEEDIIVDTMLRLPENAET